MRRWNILRALRPDNRLQSLRQAEEAARDAFWTARRRHEPSNHLHRRWAIAKAKRITAEMGA